MTNCPSIIPLPGWVVGAIANDSHTTSCRGVLLAVVLLALRAGHEAGGTLTATWATVATEMGVSRSTVRRARIDLIRIGFLSTRRRGRHGTEWTLHDVPLSADTSVSADEPPPEPAIPIASGSVAPAPIREPIDTDERVAFFRAALERYTGKPPEWSRLDEAAVRADIDLLNPPLDALARWWAERERDADGPEPGRFRQWLHRVAFQMAEPGDLPPPGREAS